jgi:integrase
LSRAVAVETHDAVWPGRGGTRNSRNTATQAAARAFIRAGLADAGGKQTATLHDLRRTCGSLMMLSRGVPLIVVSRHLGTRRPLGRARVYSHLLRDDQLAAVPAAFEEALRTPRSQQARNNRDASTTDTGRTRDGPKP